MEDTHYYLSTKKRMITTTKSGGFKKKVFFLLNPDKVQTAVLVAVLVLKKKIPGERHARLPH